MTRAKTKSHQAIGLRRRAQRALARRRLLPRGPRSGLLRHSLGGNRSTMSLVLLGADRGIAHTRRKGPGAAVSQVARWSRRRSQRRRWCHRRGVRPGALGQEAAVRAAAQHHTVSRCFPDRVTDRSGERPLADVGHAGQTENGVHRGRSATPPQTALPAGRVRHRRRGSSKSLRAPPAESRPRAVHQGRDLESRSRASVRHRRRGRQDGDSALLFLIHLLGQDLGLQGAHGGRGPDLLQRVRRDHGRRAELVPPELRVLGRDLPLSRGQTESNQLPQLLARHTGEQRGMPHHQQGLCREAAVHASGFLAKPESQWNKGARGLVKAGQDASPGPLHCVGAVQVAAVGLAVRWKNAQDRVQRVPRLPAESQNGLRVVRRVARDELTGRAPLAPEASLAPSVPERVLVDSPRNICRLHAVQGRLPRRAGAVQDSREKLHDATTAMSTRPGVERAALTPHVAAGGVLRGLVNLLTHALHGPQDAEDVLNKGVRWILQRAITMGRERVVISPLLPQLKQLQGDHGRAVGVHQKRDAADRNPFGHSIRARGSSLHGRPKLFAVLAREGRDILDRDHRRLPVGGREGQGP